LYHCSGGCGWSYLEEGRDRTRLCGKRSLAIVCGRPYSCGRQSRTLICSVCALALMGVAGPIYGRQSSLDSVVKWAWPAYGGCGWSYLWKTGKAGLCSEVGVWFLPMVGVVGLTCGRQARLDFVLKWA
jgi:hypothetical protein